jgi:hypothetical protein
MYGTIVRAPKGRGRGKPRQRDGENAARDAEGLWWETENRPPSGATMWNLTANRPNGTTWAFG